MASISLGMAEGQKIAQGLALGQMNTIAGMSKASTDAEKEAQYYRPGAVAMRDLIDYESLQATDNIVKNRDLIRALNLDPINAGPAVLEQTMGKSDPASKWVIEPADAAGSTYKAVEYSADGTKGRGDGIYREIALGDRSQTAGVLAQNLTATTLDQLKRIEALKSASDASHIKMGEKLYESQLEKLYKTDPTLKSQETRTKMITDTDKATTSMTVAGGIQKAWIDKNPGAKDRQEALDRRLQLKGIRVDKEGQAYWGATPIQDLPVDKAKEVAAAISEEMYAVEAAGAAGGGVLMPTPTIMKKVGGIPTKSATAPKAAGTNAQPAAPAMDGRAKLGLLLGIEPKMQLRKSTPTDVGSMTNRQILGIR